MKRTDADIASGAIFMVIAGCFAFPTFSYGLGTALRLGAGVYPLVISIVLGVVGGSLVVTGLLRKRVDPIKPFDIRAMFFILIAMIFGALTLRTLGIVVAIPGTILIASFASPRAALKPIIWTSVLLTVFTWLVFVKALQVRLPLLVGVL